MRKIRKHFLALKSCISGYGFAFIATLCVSIITATALWARKAPTPAAIATPPVVNLPASAGIEQSLADAQATPVPSLQPPVWQAPLSAFNILQGFSDVNMTRSGSTGLWSLHTAVDIEADAGAPIQAIASGYVIECGTDATCGTWITIQHDNSYTSRYSSLQMLGAFRPGDAVRRGNTIGFAGNTYTGEEYLGPHLHLEVLHNGTPIDPLVLLN